MQKAPRLDFSNTFSPADQTQMAAFVNPLLLEQAN
jgi:hypothetical protein